MGLYARHILPRLIDIAMRNSEIARLRAEWIPQAQGEVLEIGAGSGLNLDFYSADVKRVYGVAAWQNRITPAWKRFTGGCHLNRKIDELIAAAGFQITELKTFYLPGPRPLSYTYQGLARRL